MENERYLFKSWRCNKCGVNNDKDEKVIKLTMDEILSLRIPVRCWFQTLPACFRLLRAFFSSMGNFFRSFSRNLHVKVTFNLCLKVGEYKVKLVCGPCQMSGAPSNNRCKLLSSCLLQECAGLCEF